MLSVEVDKENSVAILEPNGPLSKEDFGLAAKAIDLYIDDAGKLSGLVIHAERFPGWDSFAALISHLKFVKEHHKKISHVALSTDSIVGSLAQALANHFVEAEIKKFTYQELDKAKLWAGGTTAVKHS